MDKIQERVSKIASRLNRCASDNCEGCKYMSIHRGSQDYVACQEQLIRDMANECRTIERMIKEQSSDFNR